MHDDWRITIKPKPRRPGGERVYVSINKRGEIAMNAAAFRRIGQPATVTLLYDDVHKRIGVKFPVPLDRNFFPVRRYGRDQQMRIVRAGRLLKQFNLKITQTLIYKNCPLQNLNGHPMLVLSLNEGLTTP
jgi:hypothetical protein